MYLLGGSAQGSGLSYKANAAVTIPNLPHDFQVDPRQLVMNGNFFQISGFQDSCGKPSCKPSHEKNHLGVIFYHPELGYTVDGFTIP